MEACKFKMRANSDYAKDRRSGTGGGGGKGKGKCGGGRKGKGGRKRESVNHGTGLAAHSSLTDTFQ
jgi:hypothetical protein